MTIPAQPAGGGPQTEAGKLASSRNALTHGIFSTWFEPREQAAFDEYYNQLLQEYGDLGPTALILVDRAATMMVKLKRVQQVEDGLYQKARIVRAQQEKQAHQNSITNMMGGGDDSRDVALAIAVASAMPDTAALDSMARYETNFERHLFRSLQALKVLKDERLAGPRLTAQNSSIVRLERPASHITVID